MEGYYQWVSLVTYIIMTQTVLLLNAQENGTLYFIETLRTTTITKTKTETKVSNSVGVMWLGGEGDYSRLRFTPQNFPSNPRGLTLDQSNHLYLTERGSPSVASSKFICKYNLKTEKCDRKYRFPSAYVPLAIAVDPLSNLVFYVEDHFKTINVVDVNSSFNSMKVITKGLDKTTDLAVHPLKSLLFWSDAGSSPHIARSYMDGSDQSIIIKDNITTPTAIDVDIQADKLYWADQDLGKVAVCDLDGTNCKDIFTSIDRKFTSLALGEKNIYLTALKENIIYQIPKTAENGTLTQVELKPLQDSNRTNIRALAITMEALFYQGQGQCSSENKSCDQICLPGRLKPTCRCTEGYKMEVNGTCSELPFDKGLFFTDQRYPGLYRLDLEHNLVKRLPLIGHNKPGGIDYDRNLKVVYWADSRNKAILSVWENGKNFKRVKQFKELLPVGVAVDEKRHTIYILEPFRKSISSLHYNDGKEEIVIYNFDQYDKPYDIALDTVQRKMYWTVGGSTPRIERANMDGGIKMRERETFLTKNIKNPRGLTIDLTVQGGVLYWADSDLGSLEAVELETRKRQVIYQEDGIKFTGMTLGRGQLFSSIENEDYIFSINIITKLPKRYGAGLVGNVYDLVYYDREPPAKNYIPVTTERRNNGQGNEVTSGDVNKTMVISLAVVFGGLFLITLVVVGGCVLYRKMSASQAVPADNTHWNKTYNSKEFQREESVYDELRDMQNEERLGMRSPTNHKPNPFGLLRPLPSIPRSKQKELQQRQPPMQMETIHQGAEGVENPSDIFRRASEKQRQFDTPDLLSKR